MKPNVSCWRTEAQKFYFGNTVKIKKRKSRTRHYFSLVLRSLNWACHPAVHPTRGLRGPHHASFTYILTATTSPIMHFCGKRGRSSGWRSKQVQSYRWWSWIPAYALGLGKNFGWILQYILWLSDFILYRIFLISHDVTALLQLHICFCFYSTSCHIMISL